MLLVDSLIVLGMSTVGLGTIHEADGVQTRHFWLQNAGSEPVALTQGYTSCGCTTVEFPQNRPLAPADSACVTLRFNPRGKGGEFEETATLVYGSRRQRVRLTLMGTCITSEETLLRQFPIRITDQLRLSANRFDVGRMAPGETKQRTVVVLHRDEGDRRESVPIVFTAPPADSAKGVQHVACPIVVEQSGQKLTLTITFDVIVTGKSH